MGYDRIPIRESERLPALATSLFLTDASVVRPTVSISVVESDPDDDKFFECAVAADADVLVTCDTTDLAPHDGFRGIRVVSPREFLTLRPPDE